MSEIEYCRRTIGRSEMLVSEARRTVQTAKDTVRDSQELRAELRERMELVHEKAAILHIELHHYGTLPPGWTGE